MAYFNFVLLNINKQKIQFTSVVHLKKCRMLKNLFSVYIYCILAVELFGSWLDSRYLSVIT